MLVSITVYVLASKVLQCLTIRRYSISCICYKASNSNCIFLGNNKSTTGILSTSFPRQQVKKNKLQTDMLGTQFAHQRDLGHSTKMPVWKYDFFRSRNNKTNTNLSLSLQDVYHVSMIQL